MKRTNRISKKRLKLFNKKVKNMDTGIECNKEVYGFCFQEPKRKVIRTEMSCLSEAMHFQEEGEKIFGDKNKKEEQHDIY